jgi:hypothetical protein
MKIFRKKVKQHEKDLAEARELAAQRLERYLADRRDSPPMPLKKSVSVITRLRWW